MTEDTLSCAILGACLGIIIGTLVKGIDCYFYERKMKRLNEQK